MADNVVSGLVLNRDSGVQEKPVAACVEAIPSFETK